LRGRIWWSARLTGRTDCKPTSFGLYDSQKL